MIHSTHSPLTSFHIYVDSKQIHIPSMPIEDSDPQRLAIQ